jgi:hypothetical protein
VTRKRQLTKTDWKSAEGTGFEPVDIKDNSDKDLRKSTLSSAAQSGAISTDSADVSDMRCPTPHCETTVLADPDLALLVSRWPTLAVEMRREIMDLLNAMNDQ